MAKVDEVKAELMDYSSLNDGLKDLKKYVPAMGSAAYTGLEMDAHGNFRISVDGKKGEWTGYRGIATLKVGDMHYIGVSAYYDGNMPIEQVLKIEVVSTMKNKP
jgi:hypothetical protein